MPVLSGIYDSDYIQPAAKIKENLSILSLSKWAHYRIDYQEPIAPGPASIVDMVVQAAATSIAANGTIAKRVVTILQVNDSEFLHVRYEPIDNVEGLVWEQAGQQKSSSRNIHSRVDKMTRNWDPFLSSTTFFVLGLNRDMNLECRNPMGYAVPAARFQFFGIRYILSLLNMAGVPVPDQTKLANGEIDAVRKYIGTTTWVPAEGRQS